MSDSVSLGRVQQEYDDETDQMKLSQIFGSAKRPTDSSSSEIKPGKTWDEKNTSKGPKIETKEVLPGHGRIRYTARMRVRHDLYYKSIIAPSAGMKLAEKVKVESFSGTQWGGPTPLSAPMERKVLPDHGPSRCTKQMRLRRDLHEDSVADTSMVMKRAQEIQSNLAPELPSFITIMTNKFRVDLPTEFCKLHLPDCNNLMILEDESGKEYKTIFFKETGVLRSRWRELLVESNLAAGDVVIFQLVQALKFKVYIVRADDLGQADDGALGFRCNMGQNF